MKKWRPGKRIRIQPDQIDILKENFEKDANWSYDMKIEIGLKVGLNPTQVKKWNYDEKKRRGMATAARSSVASEFFN